MNMLTIALELPRDLLGALEVPRVQVETRLCELIALELFREGRISSGKGAKLLGATKLAFIQLLTQHQVPYFTESSKELMAEVMTLEHLLTECDA